MKEVWFYLRSIRENVMLQGSEYGYTEYDVSVLDTSEYFDSFEEAWAKHEEELGYTSPIMKGYVKE